MSVNSNLVEHYAQRAAEFERVYQKPERQEELQQLKNLIRTRLAGRQVLEVASGTGYWTEVAATSARSILAVDINEAMLDIARRKPIDPRKVRFQLGDAYDVWSKVQGPKSKVQGPKSKVQGPKSAVEGFDGVLVAFWWSHVPRERLAGFLKELHRPLGTETLVLFLDNTCVPGNSTPLSRTDRHGNTYQMRQLDRGGSFEVLKNYPSDQELRDALHPYAGQLELGWLKYYWWVCYRTLDLGLFRGCWPRVPPVPSARLSEARRARPTVVRGTG